MHIQKFTIRLFGYFFISIIYVFFILITCIPVIGVLTLSGISLPDIRPFSSIQARYYMDTRNTWQLDPNCAVPDKNLVYRPKEGQCLFSNVEFSTELNFDENGRVISTRRDTTDKNITILGDSHAMGWGVNDNQTFASLLQNEVDHPVFNLSVSSYATERELKRFVQWERNVNTDVIIIQYCINDYQENLEYPIDTKLAASRYEAALDTDRSFLASTLKIYDLIVHKVLNRYDAAGPSNKISEKLNVTTAKHKEAFLNVLKKFDQHLTGKRIIVFYLNGNGASMESFSEIRSESTYKIEFMDLRLNENHFYNFDDHLNAEGHKYVSNALLKALQSKSF